MNNSLRVINKRGDMWSYLLLFFGVVIIIFGGIYLSEKLSRNSPDKVIGIDDLKTDFHDGTTCIKDNCFDIALASTESERTKGLGGYELLANNNGMLLVFDKEGNQSIWMKNMKFPLDILWINEDGKIVFLAYNYQPCKENDYCPSVINDVPAKYVLEINSGLVNKIGIRPGDYAIIKIRNK